MPAATWSGGNPRRTLGPSDPRAVAPARPSPTETQAAGRARKGQASIEAPAATVSIETAHTQMVARTRPKCRGTDTYVAATDVVDVRARVCASSREQQGRPRRRRRGIPDDADAESSRRALPTRGKHCVSSIASLALSSRARARVPHRRRWFSSAPSPTPSSSRPFAADDVTGSTTSARPVRRARDPLPRRPAYQRLELRPAHVQRGTGQGGGGAEAPCGPTVRVSQKGATNRPVLVPMPAQGVDQSHGGPDQSVVHSHHCAHRTVRRSHRRLAIVSTDRANTASACRAFTVPTVVVRVDRHVARLRAVCAVPPTLL